MSERDASPCEAAGMPLSDYVPPSVSAGGEVQPSLVPFLSILVPARNEQSHIRQTLEMLLAQDYPSTAYEILVIDGQSTDRTRPIVQEFIDCGAPVRLLENPRIWSSAARNIGAQAARGDLLLVIDGHCELPNRQHFCHVTDAFQRSGADVIGRPQPLTVANASPLQRAIALARASYLGHHPDSFIYSSVDRYVPAQSVGAAYRRSVFDRVGYFDERFDACEDVDFNYRVDSLGLICYLSAQAAVYYFPRRNLSGLFWQLARYGRGRVRLARKHLATCSWKSLAPAVFVAMLLICLLAAAVSSWGRWALASLVGSYLTVILLASLWISLRERAGRAGWWLPAVFATIHISAGVGILQEWLFGRRNMAAEQQPSASCRLRDRSAPAGR
jgi:succinoglycan biosynthesis protein ExoA